MQMPVQNDILAMLVHFQAAHSGLPLVAVLCVLALLGVALVPVVAWLMRERHNLPAPRQRADLEVFRSARRDPLTSLPNRTGFSEALSRRLQAGTRSALILIDLDRFKDINSLHGPAAAADARSRPDCTAGGRRIRPPARRCSRPRRC
jgi:predicted signal transduction protein with EAL and GGDEF domain